MKDITKQAYLVASDSSYFNPNNSIIISRICNTDNYIIEISDYDTSKSITLRKEEIEFLINRIKEDMKKG